MNDKVVKPQPFHDLYFFLQGIQQPDIGVFLQNHPRVREKSEYRGFVIAYLGTIYEAFQYFSVADMNPIKSSYGDCGGMLFIVIGNALDCYHVGKIIKRLTFKTLKSPRWIQNYV